MDKENVVDRQAIGNLLDFYFTAFNRLDSEAVASLFVEDATLRDLAMGREMRGRSEIAAFVTEISSLSPDFSLTRRQTLIDGSRAAVMHDMAGTHAGEFMGFPATGRLYHVPVSTYFEFHQGKISCTTDNWNLLTLLNDLRLTSLVYP